MPAVIPSRQDRLLMDFAMGLFARETGLSEACLPQAWRRLSDASRAGWMERAADVLRRRCRPPEKESVRVGLGHVPGWSREELVEVALYRQARILQLQAQGCTTAQIARDEHVDLPQIHAILTDARKALAVGRIVLVPYP